MSGHEIRTLGQSSRPRREVMGDREINLVHRGYLALTACGERRCTMSRESRLGKLPRLYFRNDLLEIVYCGLHYFQHHRSCRYAVVDVIEC